MYAQAVGVPTEVKEVEQVFCACCVKGIQEAELRIGRLMDIISTQARVIGLQPLAVVVRIVVRIAVAAITKSWKSQRFVAA